jgi:peptidoglycan/LPS O-acetylase OafA/YrhL
MLLGILLIIALVALLAVGLWSINTGTWPELLQLLECCSFLGVLGVTIVVTISGFLLWHSLLVAILAGGSIMTVMLIVLSIAAASYKAGSQSS